MRLTYDCYLYDVNESCKDQQGQLIDGKRYCKVPLQTLSYLLFQLFKPITIVKYSEFIAYLLTLIILRI